MSEAAQRDELRARVTLAERVQKRRETVAQRLGRRVNVQHLLSRDTTDEMRDGHYRALQGWMRQDPTFDNQDDREMEP